MEYIHVTSEVHVDGKQNGILYNRLYSKTATVVYGWYDKILLLLQRYYSECSTMYNN